MSERKEELQPDEYGKDKKISFERCVDKVMDVMKQAGETENLQLVEFGQKGSTAEAGDSVGLREKRLSTDVEVLSPSLASSQLGI